MYQVAKNQKYVSTYQNINVRFFVSTNVYGTDPPALALEMTDNDGAKTTFSTVNLMKKNY